MVNNNLHNQNYNNNHQQQQHGGGAGSAASSFAGTSGYFTGAPVTKLLIMVMGLSFVLVHTNGPVAHTAFHYNTYALQQESSLVQFFFSRLLVSKVLFATTSDCVTGGLLVSYWSRKFEREMGSVQYSLFVAWTTLTTIILEHIFITMRASSAFHSQYQYSGPYALLGALLWLYHWYTPRLYPRFIGGVAGLYLSEKTFLYLWLAQVLSSGARHSSSPSHTGGGAGGGLLATIVSFFTGGGGSLSMIHEGGHHGTVHSAVWMQAGFGLLASLLFCHFRPTLVQTMVDSLPPALVKAFSRFSSRLLESPPRILVPQVPTGLGGVAQPRGGNGGGGTGRHQLHPGSNNNNNAMGGLDAALQAALAASRQHAQPAAAAAPAAPPAEPDPAAIEQLVHMGFDRAQVIAALQATQNNVARAADRLLSQHD